MKRRKRLFIVLAAAALSFAAAAGAAAGSDERTVAELVRQRTEVLSEYYDGRLPKEDAEQVIRGIEAGELARQDLENVESYFQTDVDRIRDFEILSVTITEADEDLVCARVSIRWRVEALEGEASFTRDYSVICLRQKDCPKLVQFF